MKFLVKVESGTYESESHDAVVVEASDAREAARIGGLAVSWVDADRMDRLSLEPDRDGCYTSGNELWLWVSPLKIWTEDLVGG
jgi:hypothetical protein